MAKPMRVVSIKLSDPLDEALRTLATRRGSSRSAVVREAVEAMVAGSGRSVTAAVDALLDPIDGPADLSTNPAHMSRYGK